MVSSDNPWMGRENTLRVDRRANEEPPSKRSRNYLANVLGIGMELVCPGGSSSCRGISGDSMS